MSTLLNQQINNTYQGLIKLADSTTGVTSNLQSVQDGLGNDLPFSVSNNQFKPNVGWSVPKYGIGDFYGVGLTAAATAPVANTQNHLIATAFYDSGELSYSAISYNLITATTTSDVVNISFYSTQWIDGIGLCPKDVVLSGLTWQTSGPGVKTDTFATPLSFSAYGPGIYWIVYQISNANVTPSVRYVNYPTVTTNLLSQTLANNFGFIQAPGSNVYGAPFKVSATGTVQLTIAYPTTTYPNPFTSTIANTATSLGAVATFGFILHTTK